MRLWHYKLLSYLPRAQLLSQWRECVCIAKNIHDKGTPNHLLVNKVTEYPIEEFNIYCSFVANEMLARNINVSYDSVKKIEELLGVGRIRTNGHDSVFNGWHNDEYLRICMANLYEKFLGVGKNKITDYEWATLKAGYERITGGEYHV